MNPLCHICSSPSPFLLKKDGFNLYKCPSCSLVFVHPQPSIEYLRTSVYSKESGFQSNRAEDLSKTVPSLRYKKMYKLIKEQNPKAHILDVGAGGGHFLYWAHKNGFSGMGVELNERTALSAKSQGIQMIVGTLSEVAPTLETKFDCVVMGELIEHVNDPRELLAVASSLLKGNGFILVTTPNLDCFWSKSTFLLYKIFGIPWSSATPPFHLFQFSSSNLDLLSRQIGLTKIKEDYVGTPPIKYELGMLHLFKKYKQTKNVGDLMFMIFSYFLYISFYFLNTFTSLFIKKDFNMIKLYKKNSN